MANRIQIGKRGSEVGLWISKPGFNVMTTSLDNMLLASTREAMQVMTGGSVTFSALNQDRTVNIPDYGFRPLVLLRCLSYLVRLTYNSRAQFVLRSEYDAYEGGSAVCEYVVVAKEV